MNDRQPSGDTPPAGSTPHTSYAAYAATATYDPYHVQQGNGLGHGTGYDGHGTGLGTAYSNGPHFDGHHGYDTTHWGGIATDYQAAHQTGAVIPDPLASGPSAGYGHAVGDGHGQWDTGSDYRTPAASAAADWSTPPYGTGSCPLDSFGYPSTPPPASGVGDAGGTATGFDASFFDTFDAPGHGAGPPRDAGGAPAYGFGGFEGHGTGSHSVGGPSAQEVPGDFGADPLFAPSAERHGPGSDSGYMPEPQDYSEYAAYSGSPEYAGYSEYREYPGYAEYREYPEHREDPEYGAEEQWQPPAVDAGPEDADWGSHAAAPTMDWDTDGNADWDAPAPPETAERTDGHTAPEPDPASDSAGEPAAPGAAPRSAPRSRRRASPKARRSALLTVAVPSAAVMGVAAVAAASVHDLDPGGSGTAQATPDPADFQPIKANAKLDTQLSGLSREAVDFADRASRTQERIDLKKRREEERKRREAAAARREALRPKFAIPVAQHGLSAYYGQAGVNWMSLHTGIDFPVNYGTPVMAATDGTVRTQWDPAYGNMTIVTAADGTETWYCHLSSTKIRSGQVKAGDVIAYSGNSGNSTGPHLHFEVRPAGGSAIDPLAWLRSHGLEPT